MTPKRGRGRPRKVLAAAEDESEVEAEAQEKAEEKEQEKAEIVDVEEKPFELKDLKFRVPKGAFVAIVGRVGSGKVRR